MAKLIVFEGIDGVGKTTQLDRAYTRLRKEGSRVYRYAFPQGEVRSFADVLAKPPPGKSTNLEAARQLVYMAGMERWYRVEWADLRGDESAIVLVDRWWYSTACYAGELEVRDFVEHWMGQRAPVPDLVFWLDATYEFVKERWAKRGAIDATYENDSLRVVRENYVKSMSHWVEPERLIRLPVDEWGDAVVSDCIWNALQEELEDAQR